MEANCIQLHTTFSVRAEYSLENFLAILLFATCAVFVICVVLDIGSNAMRTKMYEAFLL